jgi:spermidine/putrescine transport system permease protein
MAYNEEGRTERGRAFMRKRTMLSRLTAAGMAVLLSASGLLTACGTTEKKSDKRIVVFNYGDYIDRDVLKQFEKETGISVAYEEFLTPEAMYTKFKNGTIHYDLICCSDYMLDKMIQEKDVRKIDMKQLSNAHNIGDTYWKLSQNFDPDNAYSVPYFWGTVGILYNPKLLDFTPDSWKDLWRKDYKDNIIMQDSVRDSFVPALCQLGYSINTTDKNELQQAKKLLIDQKELVQSYLVDEVRDDMANEQAAMAVIYSGEAGLARDYNEDLEFVVPKEGSDVWMDSWVIPKDGENYEGAVKFLDFLCREDIAMQNFEYVYYSTPNTAVLDEIDPEEKEDDPVIFQSEDVVKNCEMFRYLGKDMEEYYNYMWKELKAY